MSYRGNHFDVESARLWDLPDQRVPIGLAVSGSAVVPARRPACRPDDRDRAQARARDDVRRGGRRGQAQSRADRGLLRHRPGRGRRAGARAVPLVRARLEGQRRPARPASFEAATQFVTPEQVAEQLPCGPDVRGARGEDPALRRGGLHRDRAGADRRGAAGGVHRLGGAGAAAGAARPSEGGRGEARVQREGPAPAGPGLRRQPQCLGGLGVGARCWRPRRLSSRRCGAAGAPDQQRQDQPVQHEERRACRPPQPSRRPRRPRR